MFRKSQASVGVLFLVITILAVIAGNYLVYENIQQQEKIDQLQSNVQLLQQNMQGMQSQVLSLQQAPAQSYDAQIRELEDEIINYELMLLGRLNSQQREIEEVDDDIRRVSKRQLSTTDDLEDQIGVVEAQAADFSSVISTATTQTVQILLEVIVDDQDLSQLQAHFEAQGLRSSTRINEQALIVLGVTGSGAIVSEDGIVVTNYHVARADEDICSQIQCFSNPFITVTTSGGVSSFAEVIFEEEDIDLAFLETNFQSSAPLTFAPESSITVGEPVTAIGNPQGLEFTATQGIVSGLDQNIGDGLGNFWLQTDAPINSGNSGGPLVDKDGRIVGINTISFVGSGIEGLHFAIPSYVVEDIFEEEFGEQVEEEAEEI